MFHNFTIFLNVLIHTFLKYKYNCFFILECYLTTTDSSLLSKSSLLCSMAWRELSFLPLNRCIWAAIALFSVSFFLSNKTLQLKIFDWRYRASVGWKALQCKLHLNVRISKANGWKCPLRRLTVHFYAFLSSRYSFGIMFLFGYWENKSVTKVFFFLFL